MQQTAIASTSKVASCRDVILHAALSAWLLVRKVICLCDAAALNHEVTVHGGERAWAAMIAAQEAEEASWAAYKQQAAASMQETRKATEAALASIAAWPPLPVCPGAFGTFRSAVGCHASLHFEDVLGLDADLLALLPRPVVALIVLFPTCAAAMAYLDGLEARAITPPPATPSTPGPFFLRQRVGGVCGTIAILHALVNGARSLPHRDGDALLGRTLSEELLLDEDEDTATPPLKADAAAVCERRTQALLTSAALRAAHERAATAADGHAAARARGVRQGRHFVTLTFTGTRLLLLDGRRALPVDCGTTTPSTFLEDAAALVARLMAAAETEGRGHHTHAFGLVALSVVGPNRTAY